MIPRIIRKAAAKGKLVIKADLVDKETGGKVNPSIYENGIVDNDEFLSKNDKIVKDEIYYDIFDFHPQEFTSNGKDGVLDDKQKFSVNVPLAVLTSRYGEITEDDMHWIEQDIDSHDEIEETVLDMINDHLAEDGEYYTSAFVNLNFKGDNISIEVSVS